MSLKNLTFINTRPAHQTDALNQLLQALEAKTINFPTLEIKSANSLKTKTICQQLSNYEIAIFMSANAVFYSSDYWPLPFPITKTFAIGMGTQNALKKAGVKKIILPEKFNSEGLIALSELLTVKNKKIIIFCGENSKPLLQETLIKRGAFVTPCECYERVPPQPNNEILEQLQHEKIHGIISTSKESLINLNTILKNNVHIKKIPLIVITPEMKNLAQTQGWHSIIVCKDATNEAIIKSLTKHYFNQ